MHLFEHGDVIVGRRAPQAAEARQGRVHPVITRGRQPVRRAWRVVLSGYGPVASFGIGILTLVLNTLVWVFVIHKDCGVEIPAFRPGRNAAPLSGVSLYMTVS